MVTHVLTNFGPHTQENALPFVIAGPVTVRFAKVAGHDWPIDCGHDFSQCDGFGIASQNVATPDTTLGADEADAFQSEQDLFEVGLGESGAFSEVAHRDWEIEIVTKSEAQ
jgi:hypothetical protein